MCTTSRLASFCIAVVAVAAIAAPGCAPQGGTGPASPPVWTVDEGNPSANAAIEAKLRTTVPKLEFAGIGFGDVVQFLRDSSACNMYVNWGALAAAGIDKTTGVNVKLADVSFQKALRTILDDAGGVNPLDFIVEDGVITISTRDDLDRKTITRIYDVSDLVRRPELSQLDRKVIQELLAEALRRDRSGAGRGFAPTPGQTLKEEANELTRIIDEAFLRMGHKDLAEVIRNSVERNSWLENAGTTGTITMVPGKLVVVQTPRAHRQIAGLLAALRERSPTVSAARPAPRPRRGSPGV